MKIQYKVLFVFILIMIVFVGGCIKYKATIPPEKYCETDDDCMIKVIGCNCCGYIYGCTSSNFIEPNCDESLFTCDCDNPIITNCTCEENECKDIKIV